MAEYIDREEYCEKRCRCSNEYCDRANCPIWKAPAAEIASKILPQLRREDGRREELMVKVFCDMCGREIDYEVDGVNLDFNHYGVVNFKSPFSAEKQLCLSCAAKVCDFVENGAKEETEHA